MLRQAQTQLSTLQHTQKQLKVQVRNISKHLESEDSGRGKNFFESLFFQKPEDTEEESTSSDEPGSPALRTSRADMGPRSSVQLESRLQSGMNQRTPQRRSSIQLPGVQIPKDDNHGRSRTNEGKSSSRERIALKMGDLVMLKTVEKRKSTDGNSEGYVFGEAALRRCAINPIPKVCCALRCSISLPRN